jgi:hypothetical protein
MADHRGGEGIGQLLYIGDKNVYSFTFLFI